MQQGDFTELAEFYINRPAYCSDVLKNISAYIKDENGLNTIKIAEVGAGTGKLTKQLLEMSFSVDAVEPNDAMRSEGIKYTNEFNVSWRKGSGEETGLDSGKYDWVIMASSFHWTNPKESLPEFKRILKPNGFLTVMWNPRDLQRMEWHKSLEKKIHDIAPNIQRKSSGSSEYTKDLPSILQSTDDFAYKLFIEANHSEQMLPERYLGAWRSVNDIRAQAGEEKWQQIMREIEARVALLDSVEVPYKTRSWTAKLK